MDKLGPLAVVGLGNMGEALIKAWLDATLLAAAEVRGMEKLAERGQEMARRYGLTLCASAEDAVVGASAVLLAVKPQDVEGALAALAPGLSGQLVISICAGVTLSRLADGLPPGTPIVRAMPNTPALVGAGATVYCPNRHVDEKGRRAVERLLGAVGAVYPVAAEALLDPVTGLSGSGPAYVFTFLEALADGGVLAGLPRPLARALAVQTVLGAARLVLAGEEHTAELKDRVASPGGTTIAGLRELERGGFRSAVIEAVRAAAERSSELGG